MLQLLLDEHISSSVAAGLRRGGKGVIVHGLAEWEAGRFLGQPDELLLQEACRQKLTLVTYDLKTIPPLLKAWAEGGQAHGGVIFVDQKTIPSSDFRGLIRALQQLLREAGARDWTNGVSSLHR